MSVLVEFAMFPTDKGESVSEYVSKVVKMIDESGYLYKLTPMGTVIETDTIKESFDIIGKSYSILEPYCNRVYSTVKFDIRKDKSNRLAGKIQSVENRIGEVKK